MTKKIKFGDVIKVNLSSSFISRARCRHCKSTPTFYYVMKSPHYHQSVNRNKDIAVYLQKLYKRFGYDYYLADTPRNFTNNSAFKTQMFFSYKPRLHSSKSVTNNKGSMYVDCLSCPCRRTNWMFSQTTPTKESEARKSKIHYPNKFIY